MSIISLYEMIRQEREEEKIKGILIPGGCAWLHISAFPYVLKASSGHKWHLPARE